MLPLSARPPWPGDRPARTSPGRFTRWTARPSPRAVDRRAAGSASPPIAPPNAAATASSASVARAVAVPAPREHQDRRPRAGDDRRDALRPAARRRARASRGMTERRYSWCSRSSVAVSSRSGRRPSASTSSAARPAWNAASACGTVAGQDAAGGLGGQVVRRDDREQATIVGCDREADRAEAGVVAPGERRAAEHRRRGVVGVALDARREVDARRRRTAPRARRSARGRRRSRRRRRRPTSRARGRAGCGCGRRGAGRSAARRPGRARRAAS